MSAPWICPGCGRGMAPHMDTCDHRGLVDPIGPYLNPFQPYMAPPNTAPVFTTGDPLPSLPGTVTTTQGLQTGDPPPASTNIIDAVPLYETSCGVANCYLCH